MGEERKKIGVNEEKKVRKCRENDRRVKKEKEVKNERRYE